MSDSSCHLCAGRDLREIDGYGAFQRITSDFRPWPMGGRLAVCRDCGAIQKPATDEWRRECRSIYASYEVYPQGGGSEQNVFASSGAGEARSRLILRRLMDEFSLPDTGWHLDFGCGDGSLLRNGGELMTGWSRAGAELNESRRPEIEAIPGVEEFFAGNPEAISRRFDLVTAIHVLEHFENPAASVGMLIDKLNPDGSLMVQTPDARLNPFDLLIVDHATHFTPSVLATCLTKGGAVVAHMADDWVSRELSVVAKRGVSSSKPIRIVPEPSEAEGEELVERHLDWLDRLTAAARNAAARHPIGLFGTSIAATWLYARMPEMVAFFVDEDPARAGSSYRGLPVLAPEGVPVGASVFIAHTPAFAESVIARLRTHRHFETLPPPSFVRG